MSGRVRQVTVLSGKGGTGKTTVTASFACFADKPVLADCDVDASNLALVLQGKVIAKQDFFGSLKAEIDPAKCIRCGRCEEHCSYDAIKDFKVDRTACEGCGVCDLVCQEGAVRLVEVVSGEISIRDTPYGIVVDAEMLPGEPNSGKLAAKVKALAEERAVQQGGCLLIVDGPPGTGCPVISSLTGSDLTVVVTEPTMSGWHDLKRVIGLTEHFGIPCGVVLNKCDLNMELAEEIRRSCAASGIPILGAVPYDEKVIEAIVQGLPLPVYAPDSIATTALRSVWEQVESLLKGNPRGIINIE